MEITKEILLQQAKALEEEEGRVLAQLNVLVGRRQEVQVWLGMLEKEEAEICDADPGVQV